MNQLASDGPTAITAIESVIFVSVDYRIMVKEKTLLLGHILPLVKENESQVTLVPSIARTSWLWMGLLQLSLWSCQLLASLDNSLTQYGFVCSC